MNTSSVGRLSVTFLFAYLLILLVWYLVLAIANWKIFTKAGEPGWKAIIPIYNNYITFKISWSVKMFWIMVAATVIGGAVSLMDNSVVAAIGGIILFASGLINLAVDYMLSRSFGHGIPFALGLIIFNPVFVLILGFGGSEYRGPQR